MEKSWYRSKLVWLGVLQVLLGVVEVQPGHEINFAEVDWENVTFGLVTIILRFVTERPIK